MRPQNQSLAILLEGAFYRSFLEITEVTETAKKFSVQVYSTTRLVALLPSSRIVDRHCHNRLIITRSCVDGRNKAKPKPLFDHE